MAFIDNPLFKPRKAAPESVFARTNREIIYGRVETLKNSLETTRNVIFLPEAPVELPATPNSSAIAQVSKMVQAHAELTPPQNEIAAPVSTVAESISSPTIATTEHIEDAELSDTERALRNVDSIYAEIEADRQSEQKAA